MAALNPVFGAEIFQVEPQRGSLTLGHGGYIGGWQIAREGLDDHIGGLGTGPLGWPLFDGNAAQALLIEVGIGLRAERAEGIQIIDPEADGHILLGDQLARQAPSHPDIAKVIDNTAKDVPASTHKNLL